MFIALNMGMPAGLMSLVVQTRAFFTIGLAAAPYFGRIGAENPDCRCAGRYRCVRSSLASPPSCAGRCGRGLPAGSAGGVFLVRRQHREPSTSHASAKGGRSAR